MSWNRLYLYGCCFALLLFAACAPVSEYCSTGTLFQDGKCVPAYQKTDCGPDTVLISGRCVAAYDKTECGEGTVRKEGKCVPIDESKVECGPDTVLAEGKCIPSYKKLTCGPGTQEDSGQCLSNQGTCGPGTKEEEGVCVPEDPTSLCGPGSVRIGGKCITPASQWIRLPFEKEYSVRVSQGHHGNLSHKGDSHYAVDFPVPEGTKVVAVRGGIVVGAKGDSDKGCGNSSCADLANYVYVDHGDGTIARYLHLQYQGTRVKVGQQVCRGQLLGLSGNTGFSTGPHLHLEIMTGMNISLPIYFEELRDRSAGVIFPNTTVISQNEADTSCEPVKTSLCPFETFAYRGVLLDQAFQCRAIERGKEYTISGKVGDPSKRGIAIDFKYVGESWKRQCYEVTNGTFSFKWTWPKDKPAGFGYMLLTAAGYANGTCTSIKGWSNSLRVWANP